MNVETFRRQQRSNFTRMNDLSSAAAGPVSVTGQFMVNNVGEANADILFPVTFSQKPEITFGFEIQGMRQVVDGHALTATGAVVDWNTLDRPPFSRFYKGAKLLISSDGPGSVKFIVNWTAVGIGFSAPSV